MTEAPIWQARTTMSIRPLFTQLARRRTWAELLHAVLGLPLGIAGFVFTVVTVSVSGGLVITFVGLPLLAATGLASRHLGDGVRRLSNHLVGTAVPAPPAFRPEPGVFGWIGSCLKDGPAWRSRLYFLVKFPLGIAGFVIAAVFVGYGLGGVTYWIWRPLLPCQTGADGRCHRGAGIGPDTYLDTPGRIALTFVAGVVVLLAAPWVVRAIVRLDGLLIGALLGPGVATQRVQALEHSRAAAVDDSAATLRRIERDLHDGAQARLVALAMNVGLAREKLAEGGDPAEATRLLDSAHVTAKRAITELRDLARGIHPPVLDAGLDAALATLAAHSALPVRVSTEITDRPEPAIETMAYFCAAELLTNAAKHSAAHELAIDARTVGSRLRLRVHDDGHGGARLVPGGGLTGVADRIGTVDGTLDVDSPAGGPTTVTVEVPLTAGGRA